MFGRLIERLRTGVPVNGGTLRVHAVTPGRFSEESNIELHYQQGERDAYLLYVKVFAGRPPDYAPWVELFDINRTINIDGHATDYYDSPQELCILDLFSAELGPGARMFVEYYNDPETRRQLQSGLPVVLSRLGNKMLKLGFTWFKDWYFPEGYLEGNQKLQGEKPLDAGARARHVGSLLREIGEFDLRSRTGLAGDEYVRRGLARCREVTLMLQGMQRQELP